MAAFPSCSPPPPHNHPPHRRKKGQAASSVCCTSTPACSSIKSLHLILPSCAAFALVTCTQPPLISSYLLEVPSCLPLSVCVLILPGAVALILRTDRGRSSKGRRTHLGRSPAPISGSTSEIVLLQILQTRWRVLDTTIRDPRILIRRLAIFRNQETKLRFHTIFVSCSSETRRGRGEGIM